MVIFIPDIFGVDLVNTKLLADEWAANGWKVLLPDVLEGDAVPDSHLKAIAPNMRDKAQATLASKAIATAETAAALGPWIVKHREAGESPAPQTRRLQLTYSRPAHLREVLRCGTGRPSNVGANNSLSAQPADPQ